MSVVLHYFLGGWPNVLLLRQVDRCVGHQLAVVVQGTGGVYDVISSRHDHGSIVISTCGYDVGWFIKYDHHAIFSFTRPSYYIRLIWGFCGWAIRGRHAI